MKKLYHYVHCPFCVRVRMAAGLLGVEYESIVLPYNDEETPINLTGVKMLPIFEDQDGALNESLDIIKKLDTENKLSFDIYNKDIKAIESLLSRLGKPIHNLCMPYWIWTPEFDNESRSYFQKKKEIKRGPFNKLLLNKKDHLKELAPVLMELNTYLTPFYKSETVTICDIMIASHLWGMYVFPEFQFPQRIHEYLQKVRQVCSFEYHIDFWRD